MTEIRENSRPSGQEWIKTSELETGFLFFVDFNIRMQIRRYGRMLGRALSIIMLPSRKIYSKHFGKTYLGGASARNL